MLKKLQFFAAASCALFSAHAAAIDTGEPFLCAVSQVTECLDGWGCEAVLPEMVNAPTFIWVDLKKKRVRTSLNNEGSRIVNLVEADGLHLIQGSQTNNPEGPSGAWSMSIEDSTGRFVGAVALRQASLNLFGACTEVDY